MRRTGPAARSAVTLWAISRRPAPPRAPPQEHIPTFWRKPITGNEADDGRAVTTRVWRNQAPASRAPRQRNSCTIVGPWLRRILLGGGARRATMVLISLCSCARSDSVLEGAADDVPDSGLQGGCGAIFRSAGGKVAKYFSRGRRFNRIDAELNVFPCCVTKFGVQDRPMIWTGTVALSRVEGAPRTTLRLPRQSAFAWPERPEVRERARAGSAWRPESALPQEKQKSKTKSRP